MGIFKSNKASTTPNSIQDRITNLWQHSRSGCISGLHGVKTILEEGDILTGLLVPAGESSSDVHSGENIDPSKAFSTRDIAILEECAGICVDDIIHAQETGNMDDIEMYRSQIQHYNQHDVNFNYDPA